MNYTKYLTITGYTVKFVDLREPKPRAIQEEVYTLDREALEALAMVGVNVADFIEERYARGGYHVNSVERIPARRMVPVNLGKLWDAAAPATAKGDAACVA